MPILDPFMSFLASRFLFLTRFLSLLLLLLLLPICTSIKTISSTSPLRDGDVLISNGGNFALGFFSLNNSTNRYVGIWYNKVSERTIVWVANRDNPVRNISSGVLSVDDNYGNLILRDGERNVVVWSTNVSATARINFLPTCQLLNSGNLVLFGSEDGVAAWQSFDYPTDTVLPNMKVGWDRRTSLNRFVTSWKSDDDPATGDYSFKMNFVGLPQEILYQGVTPIWRTGTWTGIGWSGVPDMTPHGAGIPSFIFNVSYVNNEDEASIVWGILNGSNIFSRLVLRSSGSVERLTWHQDNQRWVEFWSAPRDKCDNYNHCGSFGYCDPSATDVFECNCLPGFEPKSSRDWFLRDGSGGCARVSGAPMCKNEEGFVTMPRVKVPDMTSTTRVDMRVETLKACEEMCLSNCSCLGYASGNISEGNGCITWHGDMLDIRQFPNGGQDFYIRADAAEVARYSKKTKRSHRLPVLVAVALSVAAVISLLSVAVWLTKKRRAKRRQSDELFIFNNRTSLGSPTTTRKNRDESRANVDVQMFDLSTLVAATYNFSPDNKLGEGGFGSVYKGQLRNGEEIGVKRLSAKSAQGIQEFKNEITLIAKLQHRNLVRLLGCCVQREERMLVYEYLQNKGLDCFIFDRDKAALLDWQRRFQIILGIVRGLLYLHQDSRFRIIHRDLKSSNILLDGDLNPKISDFGMARIFGGDQVEAKTARVVGTYGYMSPEYAMEGLFSIKSDVFSLGVLLLEIVSGRRNNSYYEQSSMNLIGHVWELWSEGNTMDIVDSSMGDSYDAREVTRCIHVALLCVQELPANRPTMPEVAHMLCNDMKLRSPLQPAFVLRESNYVITDRSSKMGTISINEATMSVVEAR